MLGLFATVLAASERPTAAPGRAVAALLVVAVLLAGVVLASILAHELVWHALEPIGPVAA